MKDTHCKIGKVTLKGGAELIVFPNNKENFATFDLGWGSVTFRLPNQDYIHDETLIYMLRMIENEILNGD